ncbi:aspartate/glutamate racemase family protein [Niveispirillum sp. KHB5.9]|uniref:aspartate/glutamate racemase family protein n=1 Tax=Niveispirillum sp. KHB5.9 TaxID=3400269 RepID=UPI003A84A2D3
MARKLDLRLITPVTTRGLRDLAEIAHLESADLGFSHSLIDTGPPSIESEFDEALSVPGTLARVLEAERAGVDAIIIDCMGDPGLKPARELVKVPVFGPAETSMHVAAMLGHRFSIVTVLESVRPMLGNLAQTYGVAGKLASVEVVDIPVLELGARMDEVRAGLAEKALHAVRHHHADAIVLGCTGFLGCATQIGGHLLARGYDIPVIDPIPTTVMVAAGLVRAGLRHSKKTYPTPAVKPLVGFDIAR